MTRRLLDDEVRLVVPEAPPARRRRGRDRSPTSPARSGSPAVRAAAATSSPSPTHAGFRPNVAFETEDYVAQLGLVTAGLGVALVPDLILNAAKHDEVATLLALPASRRQILAVTTPDLQRVPAVGRCPRRPVRGRRRRPEARSPAELVGAKA